MRAILLSVLGLSLALAAQPEPTPAPEPPPADDTTPADEPPPAADAARPAFELVHLGQSVQGRPLELLCYGPADATNVTLVMGGLHGDERVAHAVADRLTADLPQWAALLAPGQRLCVVPCINPDGRQARTRVNARRVDLNRNFAAGWQAKAAKPRFNPGPAPFSEPETQAAAAALARTGATKVIALHTPLRQLICTGPRAGDMARLLRAELRLPITKDAGYPTPGSFGDHCAAAGASIVTVEFGSNDRVADLWPAFRRALLAVVAME